MGGKTKNGGVGSGPVELMLEQGTLEGLLEAFNGGYPSGKGVKVTIKNRAVAEDGFVALALGLGRFQAGKKKNSKK